MFVSVGNPSHICKIMLSKENSYEIPHMLVWIYDEMRCMRGVQCALLCEPNNAVHARSAMRIVVHVTATHCSVCVEYNAHCCARDSDTLQCMRRVKCALLCAWQPQNAVHARNAMHIVVHVTATHCSACAEYNAHCCAHDSQKMQCMRGVQCALLCALLPLTAQCSHCRAWLRGMVWPRSWGVDRRLIQCRMDYQRTLQ